MDKMLTIDDLKNGLAGLLIAARGPEEGTFPRGVIDSREVAPGDLFFALHGEHHDAHDFLGQAFAAGATGAVVDRPVEAPDGRAVYHVPDTLTGLQRVAASLVAVRRDEGHRRHRQRRQDDRERGDRGRPLAPLQRPEDAGEPEHGDRRPADNP